MPFVIIADDSMFQRFNLAKLARQLGFTVIEAANGRQCLDLALEHPPDLIVLDLNMPVLGGLDVLAELKEAGLAVPVIVITADIQESTASRCLDLGAHSVIIKPFNEEQVRAVFLRLGGQGQTVCAP